MAAVSRAMGPEECRRLIQAGGVGRVAFRGASDVHIVPVNFVVDGDSIVFRTAPYSELGENGPGKRAAFEVDQLDTARRCGWSVVAKGRLHVISAHPEVVALRLDNDPDPWADGVRRLYMRLPWRELTGRQLEPPAQSGTAVVSAHRTAPRR